MKQMSILVADDDPVMRRLLEKRLTENGYQVTVVSNGMEAASLLDSNHFDVVITDMVMPGDLGGIELLQVVKERDVATEVIVITAYSSIDTAVEAMKRGAADYLEKPINFEELFLRLDKIAQVRSLIRSAGDLREAMEVTEASAAQTIQQLEITANDLQTRLDRVRGILADETLNPETRIADALRILERQNG